MTRGIALSPCSLHHGIDALGPLHQQGGRSTCNLTSGCAVRVGHIRCTRETEVFRTLWWVAMHGDTSCVAFTIKFTVGPNAYLGT